VEVGEIAKEEIGDAEKKKDGDVEEYLAFLIE
jgi:hypothetical protein